MAHRAHDGDAACIDGPGHAFLIKGPQILQAAAAPAHDQHIRRFVGVHPLDGLGDLLGRALPLHLDRVQ